MHRWQKGAQGKYGKLPEKLREKIKANACRGKYSLVFGEDIFIATGAILLMKGFFDSVGMHVGVWDMALWGIPTAISALIVSWIRFRRFDKYIEKTMKAEGKEEKEAI